MEQVCRFSIASHFSFNRDLSCPNLSANGVLVLFTPSAGAEEDSAGPNGSSPEPWLRPASCRLHSQVSGETQHRYLPH